jgi:hypothetical protein
VVIAAAAAAIVAVAIAFVLAIDFVEVVVGFASEDFQELAVAALGGVGKHLQHRREPFARIEVVELRNVAFDAQCHSAAIRHPSGEGIVVAHHAAPSGPI